MNKGITRENLLLIMPPSLTRDSSIMALAAADAEALEARLEEIDRTRVLSNIDGLDEAVLDILARDFKVDWWDADYSLEEKRRTLKGSWRVHKLLGTKAAVETAIRAIYPLTQVEEWFEYGGEPYGFKLKLDLTGEEWTDERPRRILERVEFYKSLRSHLDGLQYTVRLPAAEIRVGGGVGIHAQRGIPDKPDVHDFRGALHTGGGAAVQTALPVPVDTSPLPATTILRTGGVCTVISNLPQKGE